MKIGVVGIGYWGEKVLREYIDLCKEDTIESVEVYDVDKEKTYKHKNEVRIHGDLESLLKNVDGVHICTPNITHYEIAKTTLEKGVHGLIEKPMTMDHNQAYKLIEMAGENGLILQVGHIFRFADIIRKVKDLYENNYFGKVYYLNLRWTHRMLPLKEVDIIWDLLPHPLDILNFITGKWPDNFTGIKRTYRRNKLDEVAHLQAVFDDDLFAGIEISWLQPLRQRILEIIGSERSAQVECVKQEMDIFNDDGEIIRRFSTANNTIRSEEMNFIQAIKNGKNLYNCAIIGARAVEIIANLMVQLQYRK